MHNVEFKAELRDPALARTILRKLDADLIVNLRQIDTYFRVADGLLKRREAWVGETPEPTEWISYHRAHRADPKLSHFQIYTPSEAISRFGTLPLPEWVKVRKTRELWMIGPTRVHLDEVRDLGPYVEFESLVSPKNTVVAARAHVAELRRALSPAMGEPIAVGYAMLLAADHEDGGERLSPAGSGGPTGGADTPKA